MAWRSSGIAAATMRPGAKRELLVDGRALVIFRLSDGFFAIDGSCTHLGGQLIDGKIDHDGIVCPEHGATFEIRTGAVRADPDGVVPPEGVAQALRSYRVRETGGLLEIDVEGPPS